MGVFPGSFNPPTIAHLEIADAALAACRLQRIDLCVSRVALGKEGVQHPRFDDRVAVIETLRVRRPWLGVRVTDARLLVDLAAGYDWLILGADKWAQVIDPAWYGGSIAARDDALRRLPRIAIAARAPHPVPADGLLLDVEPSAVDGVSSTAARAGERGWMAAEASEFAERTGAWIDLERYERAHRGDDDPNRDDPNRDDPNRVTGAVQ